MADSSHQRLSMVVVILLVIAGYRPEMVSEKAL